MAILDSNGLKTLAAQIAATYGTKTDLSELETKIAACATKDDIADMVSLSALSGFVTYYAAAQNFLSIADADNFVEECRLADFVENSALENFLTLDDAAKFAEKSALEDYVTNVQLDSLLQNYATSAAVDEKFNYCVTNTALDEKLKDFATTADVDKQLGNFLTVAEVDT
ncbi:MAG: hypothetical protein IKN27_05245 [Selenomonadaceae bacterium]|nr:hypothetical protein [Selenomonadaceae bacterium]